MKTQHVARKSAAITATAAIATVSAFAVSSAATAQTPPAPTNHGPVNLSNKPLVDSGHKINHRGQSSTSNSVTLKWEATKQYTTLQTSTTKPVKTKTGWKFNGGPVQPVIVKGTPTHQGGKDTLTGGKTTYSFSKTITGLKEHKGYYSVATVPVGPGYKPVQQAWLTVTKFKNGSLSTTKVRQVRMTVGSVKVTKDADSGLRGKGEVRFGVRLAPDADPMKASNWGSWSHNWDDYTKAGTGDTVKFRNPLTHTITTTKSTAFVEVQGYENDIDAFDYCAIEGGPDTAKQYSDKCFDAAVAQGSLKLTTKKHGVTTQYVTAKVYRSPALQFTAVVKVESWFK